MIPSPFGEFPEGDFFSPDIAPHEGTARKHVQGRRPQAIVRAPVGISPATRAPFSVLLHRVGKELLPGAVIPHSVVPEWSQNAASRCLRSHVEGGVSRRQQRDR